MKRRAGLGVVAGLLVAGCTISFSASCALEMSELAEVAGDAAFGYDEQSGESSPSGGILGILLGGIPYGGMIAGVLGGLYAELRRRKTKLAVKGVASGVEAILESLSVSPVSLDDAKKMLSSAQERYGVRDIVNQIRKEE